MVLLEKKRPGQGLIQGIGDDPKFHFEFLMSRLDADFVDYILKPRTRFAVFSYFLQHLFDHTA